MLTGWKEQSLDLSFGGNECVDTIVGNRGMRVHVTMPLIGPCKKNRIAT